MSICILVLIQSILAEVPCYIPSLVTLNYYIVADDKV